MAVAFCIMPLSVESLRCRFLLTSPQTGALSFSMSGNNTKIEITKENAIRYLVCIIPSFIACAMQYRLIIEFIADGWGWLGILASQVIAVPVGLVTSYYMVYCVSSMEHSALVARLNQNIATASATIQALQQEIASTNLKAEAAIRGNDLAIQIAMKEADNRINDLSSHVAYLKTMLEQTDEGSTLPKNWQLCYVRLTELVSLGLIERNGERISISYAQKNLTKQNFPIEQDRNNGAASMIQVKELMQKGFSVSEKGLLRRHLYAKTGEGAFAPLTLAA